MAAAENPRKRVSGSTTASAPAIHQTRHLAPAHDQRRALAFVRALLLLDLALFASLFLIGLARARSPHARGSPGYYAYAAAHRIVDGPAGPGRATGVELRNNPAALAAVAERVLQDPVSRRIVVSEISRLIYCPVPKAANSNWKYLIRKWEGYEDYPDLSKAHSFEESGLRYLSDYDVDEVAQLLTRPDYTKFVFVRDPQSRAISAYVNKFRNPNATSAEYRVFLAQLYDWRWVKDHMPMGAPAREIEEGSPARGETDRFATPGVTDPASPSFRAFVDELLKQDPETMNSHWMPQTYVCGLDYLPYDFVGRFEKLDDDARLLLQLMDETRMQFHPDETSRLVEWDHFPSQDEIRFPESGAGKVADEFLTRALLLKLRLVYDVDFTLLGY